MKMLITFKIGPSTFLQRFSHIFQLCRLLKTFPIDRPTCLNILLSVSETRSHLEKNSAKCPISKSQEVRYGSDMARILSPLGMHSV